ncbi:MAG: tetratricopeptide repeat protein [Phycisphaeraceae bacterium]|nr:tetratricopeptide repeat protein [Phycisphaeraceae bacterium]
MTPQVSRYRGFAGLWPAAATGNALRIAALVVAVLAVYVPRALEAPFLHDDQAGIETNGHLARGWLPDGSFWAPKETTIAGRPVAAMTIAANYALGGLRPWGYHAVNVAIHIAVAWAVMALATRLFQTPRLTETFGGLAPQLAWWIALIWAVHPLTTMPVVYVIQRTESLMSLFYVLTLLGVAGAWRGGRHVRGWVLLAVAACALGMGCKESMVSAPLMAWLLDRTLVSGSFIAAWRARRGLYLGLASTWIILGVLVAAQPRGQSAGLGLGVSSWEYALTQAQVLLHMFRLICWPDPLVFAYQWPLARGVGDVPWSLPAMAILIAATAWAAARNRPVGLVGAWTLMILAPSSSVVPIVTEVASEHRMYLPLAGLLAGAVAVTWRLLARAPRPGAARVAAVPASLIVIVLAGVSYVRLGDYRDAVTLWRDTVAKQPLSAEARESLGVVLLAAGQTDEAVEQLHKAMDLEPRLFNACYNLGAAMEQRRDMERAAAWYRRAVELNPAYAPAWNNLGALAVRQGRLRDAREALERAVQLSPNYPLAQFNLGYALYAQDRWDEAVGPLLRAVELRPNMASWRHYLGLALAKAGRLAEAATQFEQVLRLDPDHEDARENLRQCHER